MKTWFARNWRRLALLIAGAAGALTAEHTVYKRTGLDQVVPVIINSIPPTPGEAPAGAELGR